MMNEVRKTTHEKIEFLPESKIYIKYIHQGNSFYSLESL